MRWAALVLIMAGAAQAEEPFPVGDPAAEGIDPRALAELAARSDQSKSTALVIVKNGKLLLDKHAGAPRAIETMSATKSIVSLAIGRLIDEGKIASLDQPVWAFFPEWKQGRKQSITLRHLLNHTSGLQAQPTTEEIYAAPDFVRLALAAELSDEPGSKFFYNNKAVNLLAGVVRAASGKPLDEYVRDFLFAPLGITDWQWSRDRAGNPHAMSGLKLRAIDLAKIGQLLADGGVWRGRRIVSERWIAQSTAPGQPLMKWCGLLWWLKFASMKFTIDEATIAAWRKGGVDEAFIARVAPMKDRLFTRDEFFAELKQRFADGGGIETWHARTWRAGLPDGALVPGPVAAFYADGWLGQYLVVLPKEHLVAVRQLAARDDHPDARDYDGWQKFPEAVQALVKQ